MPIRKELIDTWKNKLIKNNTPNYCFTIPIFKYIWHFFWPDDERE